MEPTAVQEKSKPDEYSPSLADSGTEMRRDHESVDDFEHLEPDLSPIKESATVTSGLGEKTENLLGLEPELVSGTRSSGSDKNNSASHTHAVLSDFSDSKQNTDAEGKHSPVMLHEAPVSPIKPSAELSVDVSVTGSLEHVPGNEKATTLSPLQEQTELTEKPREMFSTGISDDIFFESSNPSNQDRPAVNTGSMLGDMNDFKINDSELLQKSVTAEEQPPLVKSKYQASGDISDFLLNEPEFPPKLEQKNDQSTDEGEIFEEEESFPLQTSHSASAVPELPSLAVDNLMEKNTEHVLSQDFEDVIAETIPEPEEYSLPRVAKSDVSTTVKEAIESECGFETEKLLNTMCPYAWFNPEKLNPKVVELVYWRDPKKSGIVFGTILGVLLSLTYFSLISVIAYLSLLLLTATISFRIYKTVLQAVQKTQDGHPFKDLLELDLALPQDKVQQVTQVAVSHLNAAVAELRRLFLVEDLVDSIKFGVLLWCLTYVGAWFNGMTLIIIAFVALFTLPKVYENNKTQIDQNLEIVRSKVADITSRVKAAVPLGKKEKDKEQ